MKILFRLLPVLLLLVFACKKQPINNFIALSDFPIKSGDSWTYQVYDSIQHTTDTAIFSITGNYALNGSRVYYTTQTVIAGNVIDSGLIIKNLDSVFYQPYGGSGLFSNITLLFPFAQGSKWKGDFYMDSVFVITGNTQRSLLGNTYSQVCEVGRINQLVDYYIDEHLYIAPGIGIIEADLNISSWIQQHKIVKLISYSVH